MTHSIRRPAVAGTFYPASANEIETMFRSIEPCETVSNMRGCVVPHAGYMFSLEVAYRLLSSARSTRYDRAVIVAPSHRVALRGFALSSFEAFQTPLGEAKTDRDAVALFARDAGELAVFREDAHVREHAVEVEVPILQHFWPDMPIVPVVMGELSLSETRSVARSLQNLFDARTLWVISSDFTHYGANFGYLPFRDDVARNMKSLDMGAVHRICSGDLNAFASYVASTGATICGAQPIRLMMALAEASGKSFDIQNSAYCSSGEKTGEWSHAVGYASIRWIQK